MIDLRAYVNRAHMSPIEFAQSFQLTNKGLYTQSKQHFQISNPGIKNRAKFSHSSLKSDFAKIKETAPLEITKLLKLLLDTENGYLILERVLQIKRGFQVDMNPEPFRQQGMHLPMPHSVREEERQNQVGLANPMSNLGG